MLRGCLPRCMSSTVPVTWKCWVWSPRSTLHWVWSPSDTGVSFLLRLPISRVWQGWQPVVFSLRFHLVRIWRCRWSGWMRRKLERGCAWLEVISTKLWMDGEEWIEKEVCRQSEEWARRHQTLRKVTELSQNSWSSSSSSWPAPPPSPWPCPSPTSACSCPPPSGQPPWLSWLCPLVFSPLALEWE